MNATTFTFLNRIGIIIACALALFLIWMKLFPLLVANYGFSPHGDCFLWNQKLLILFVGSDTSIGLSYIVISATLAYLVAKVRQSLPFQWVFLAFGTFIVACGGTHFLDVWTLWVPIYWLAGTVKLLTAIASIITAVMLPFMLPSMFVLIATANSAEGKKRQLEQAHQELEGLYKQSKELDQLKTSFFANMSHELRTPLTLILAPVKSLLAQETFTNHQQQTLQVIERNADLLLRRINSLLDIAKVEAGKMGLTYTQIDLVLLAQESAAYFKALAEQQQILVSIEAPLSVLADVDQEKLEQVFSNLFSNAFKFTPFGGQIRCTIFSEGEWGIITLQDTGPGIPPELRQQIFKRFQQGSSELSWQTAGTGLGLAVVKEFVKLHGGTIEADEAPGGGARFTLRVPLLAPYGTAIAETRPARIPLPQVSISKEKEQPEATLAAREEESAQADILIIEDNLEMAQYISSILVSDYRVTLAWDGQDGLEKALERPPDLVLCDIMMPRMNGEQFLTAFRRHTLFDAVPVMLLSAQTDTVLRVRLLHKGAQDFLLKPFLPDEVQARVANLITMKLVRDVLQREVTQKHLDLVSLANNVAQLKRENVQVVAAMDQSERDFRLLADAMPQIVWTSYADGWHDYFNQRWFDYTGMTIEQTQGWNSEVLHPDDEQKCLDAWARCSQTGNIYEIEYRLKRASDGSYRWHLGRALPVRDTNGKILKWFGTSTDIDDQKRNEDALRASEQDFRLLADTMPQMVWTSRPDGILDYYNQRWRDYTGTTPGQVGGAVLHPDDEQRCLDIWASSIQTGKIFEMEYRLRRASDGAYCWQLARALPLRDMNGKILKWFGTCTDIEDQKRNEETLRESERRKDLFLSMASHELKTPLTSLQIFVEILHEECNESGQQSMITALAQIEAQIERIQKLIANLLDISRMQMGKLVLTEMWFDVGAFVQEIVSSVQPSYPHHPISVSGNVSLQIYADKDRLGQVLINLLSNAVKYSPQGAPVGVNIGADKEKMIVMVHDEGIGIPKEHQAHIFERFYRVYSNQDQKFPGLGIGLYIAAEVVEHHGGHIWVESIEGRGSTFCFSIPFSHKDTDEVIKSQ